MVDYIGRFVSPYLSRAWNVPDTHLRQCVISPRLGVIELACADSLLFFGLSRSRRYVTKVGHKPRSPGPFSTWCEDFGFDSPLEGVRPTIACNRNATLTGHCPDVFTETERYVSLSRRESHLFVRDIFKISSRARGAFLGRKLLQNSPQQTKNATFLSVLDEDDCYLVVG